MLQLNLEQPSLLFAVKLNDHSYCSMSFSSFDLLNDCSYRLTLFFLFEVAVMCHNVEQLFSSFVAMLNNPWYRSIQFLLFYVM